MIHAQDFIEHTRNLGYRFYAGVPCSFLTPFINYTIGDEQLRYISSANEGDAVALGVGAALGGHKAVVMMQNSGLGNAINPLTSLAHVFRVPVLLIVTLRGDPQLEDEPQHELMGRITGTLLDNMEIPWKYFPTEVKQIKASLRRAESHMAGELRPYAFIMRKDSVAGVDLPASRRKLGHGADNRRRTSSGQLLPSRLTRAKVLQRIIELTPQPDTVIVATTGYTGRELSALADRPNHLYMVGSMGCASSLGLGLALARPDLRVVVIDGDGAALMRMGSFATLGAYGGGNLVHIVLDNEAHDSTGGQATVSTGVSFTDIARACGYPLALEDDSLAVLDHVLSGRIGPRFACIKIKPGTMPDLPRPTLPPPEVRTRFMTHIGADLRFSASAPDAIS